MITSIDGLIPVSGNEPVPTKAGVGTTVEVVSAVVGVGALFGAVGVAGTATGVPVIAFDATESPIVFTALMVTE